jgi:[CysO sulfur-carrier protein]-thiocarboxylate-dependent cysteine synthase
VDEDRRRAGERAPDREQVEQMHERPVQRVRHAPPEPRSQSPADDRRVEHDRIAGPHGAREERRLAGAGDPADEHDGGRREQQHGVHGVGDVNGHAATVPRQPESGLSEPRDGCRTGGPGTTEEPAYLATLCKAMTALPPLANRPCGGRYSDLVQAIGNTPLVELRRLSPKPGVRIWAKMESFNPTGSVKDRVARSLIEDAEEKGLIRPGQTILEPTSGNTGISLAMICARKGYKLKVVMPDNVTPERTQLLQMYGAEIVYSPGAQGSNGAVAMAVEMAADDAQYYMPYQYGNDANPRAHYNGTAPEILEELDNDIAAFVAGLGTGGTLMGNARRFKEELGDQVKIVAAEPMQGEPVQGLRSLDDGFIPPIIDLSLLDRKIFVTNHDAVVWTRRLLDEEGMFVGVSSGAIASIAVRIASELDEGNVVFIVCDDGWKYLSSGIYTKPVEEIENLDSTVWW